MGVVIEWSLRCIFITSILWTVNIVNCQCYLNSAKYLQLGLQIWADHTFCSGVVHGMYSFHTLMTTGTIAILPLQFTVLLTDISGRPLFRRVFGHLYRTLDNQLYFQITYQLKRFQWLAMYTTTILVQLGTTVWRQL